MKRNTDTPQPDPDEARILEPGARYRVETRTRQVPFTLHGVTAMVPETYTVKVPVPPRDLEGHARDGFVSAALGATTFTTVWLLLTFTRVCDLAGASWFTPAVLAAPAGVEVAWRVYRRRTGRRA